MILISLKAVFLKIKTVWKSCLFEITDIDATSYTARIYSNTVAKYWSDDFLELDEMVSDESNTSKAFKAIESTLNRNIRSIAPRDHTVIRNAVISYFKNHEHFDYAVMLDSILDGYQVTDLSEEKLETLKEKLAELPERKHFDRQFCPVASVISARIKKYMMLTMVFKSELPMKYVNLMKLSVHIKTRMGIDIFELRQTTN